MLLKRRAMMFQHGSAPQRRLPYDYQELAYIETTGTQYINTNVIPDVNTKIYTKYAFTATQQTYTMQVGVQNIANGRPAVLMKSNWLRFSDATNYDAITISGLTLNDGNPHETFAEFNKLTVDGVTKTGANTFDTTISYPLYIFCRDSIGTPLADSYYIGKMYSVKIWNGSSLQRDFVPAMRYTDKVAGMYDTVNDVFYTNQGTGEFKMGPWVPYRLPEDYQEVEFIGNASRSYIDTGYKPNVNTEVELKFAVNSFGTQAGNQLMGSTNTNSGTPGYLLGATLSNSSYVLWGRMGTGTINYGFKSVTDLLPHTWIINKTGMTFDNQFYTISTPADLTVRLTYSFYLFARHQNNSIHPTSGNFNLFDVYECIIRENGSVQRHFIPCYRISDNVRGLYDIANNVFYTNKGAGTFTKGPNLPKRLPDEYQEVSYIGTTDITSKAHIDTGVVLQSVFTINARVLWHQVLTTGPYQYHGHYNPSSSAQFGAMSNATHYISSTTGADALASDIAVTANTVYSIRLKADGSTSTFTVNGSTVTGNYTFSATNPYTSFIFGRNGNETYLNAWVDGKVYSYDISKDNILVRYYVPCYRKADNVVGLYDLCGSVCSLTGTSFYTNAGSGTFTKGGNV